MKVYIEGYGCAMNINDTEKIRGSVHNQKIKKTNKIGKTEKIEEIESIEETEKIKKIENIEETEKIEEADVIIINTCAVKDTTEKRMLSRIKRIKQQKKENAKIVITGCLPKISPKEIQKIGKEIKFVGPSLKEVMQEIGIESEEYSPKIEEIRNDELIGTIVIQKGCLSNCTFCATKIARKELQSYEEKEIIEQFEKLIKENAKEIWITGQDTGCYGFDKKTNIVELIKKINQIEKKYPEKKYRIRIGMMNPLHLKKYIDEYLELFQNEKLYQFFHIPIQSGSNRILKEMKRGYEKEEAEKIIKKIQTKYPDATIATDIIVGFPSETEIEFNETLEFLKKNQIGTVNISRYGKRKGTKAAIMENQIYEWEKKRRSRIATEEIRKIAKKANEKYINEKQKVLIIEKGRNNKLIGKNQNYKSITIDENQTKLGEEIEVKIINTEAYYLEGIKIR